MVQCGNMSTTDNNNRGKNFKEAPVYQHFESRDRFDRVGKIGNLGNGNSYKLWNNGANNYGQASSSNLGFRAEAKEFTPQSNVPESRQFNQRT